MTRDEFNIFCKDLPHTTHVIQWGGADVWKIGGISSAETGALPTGKGKVFAIGGWNKDSDFGVSFKTSEIGFEMLRDAPGCRPAPYLASRGMKWIQRLNDESMSDADFCEYLLESYRLVSLGLTKKLQKELGLNQKG